MYSQLLHTVWCFWRFKKNYNQQQVMYFKHKGLKCSLLTTDTLDDRHAEFRWHRYNGNTGV